MHTERESKHREISVAAYIAQERPGTSRIGTEAALVDA